MLIEALLMVLQCCPSLGFDSGPLFTSYPDGNPKGHILALAWFSSHCAGLLLRSPLPGDPLDVSVQGSGFKRTPFTPFSLLS